jgi:uncharacterized protein YjiS (DUF1127 family)
MSKMTTLLSGAGLWPSAEQPTEAAQAGWVKSASSALAAVIWKVRAKLKARRTASILSELDDRTLRDIGLERHQIQSAARSGRDAIRGKALTFGLGRWA